MKETLLRQQTAPKHTESRKPSNHTPPPIENTHASTHARTQVRTHLLWSNNRARPAEANPRDCLRRGEAVVKHEVDGNTRAGATEAGLAVHGQRARRGLDELEELPRDRQRRRRAVGEEELVVRDALSSTGGSMRE